MLKLINYLGITMLIISMISCHHPEEEDCGCDDDISLYTDTTSIPQINMNETSKIIPPCDLQNKLIESGLVNIQDSIPLIRVDLKYSTIDNFMKADVYGCLNSCYLQSDVTLKLKKALFVLRKKHPNYTFLVYDGVRPRSVQQIMWDTLKMPFSEKIKFVSNPKNGSLHNYGAAVDITIFDNLTNQPLDMGTPYDFIGELAWPTKEKQNLKEGRLTKEIIKNRELLREIMYQGGFFNIQTEWWHFNSCRRAVAKEKYTIIE